MAKSVKHHLPPAGPETTDMLPRELTKQEFGRRLNALMLDKGWNQSELARRAKVGRDAVSTYIRGVSFPEPASLKKLSTALGVKMEELLPNTMMRAMESDAAPMMEIRQAHGQPDKAWLRVNRIVSVSTAAKVFDLLNAES